MKFSTQTVFDAVVERMLSSNTPHVDKHSIQDHVLIHIPLAIAKHIELASIYDCITSSYVEYNEYTCIREDIHPWYTLDTDVLNIEVGYHKYRMNFVNLDGIDNVTLYFAYYIYDNELEKPYIYMNKETEND